MWCLRDPASNQGFCASVPSPGSTKPFSSMKCNEDRSDIYYEEMPLSAKRKEETQIKDDPKRDVQRCHSSVWVSVKSWFTVFLCCLLGFIIVYWAGSQRNRSSKLQFHCDHILYLDVQVVCILGAHCIFCSPTASAGDTSRTKCREQELAHKFQWSSHLQSMDLQKCWAAAYGESVNVHFTFSKSLPQAWDLSSPDPWFPQAVYFWSQQSCMWLFSAPGAGLMSEWDGKALPYTRIRWFPIKKLKKPSYQDNSKSFLQDPALCCPPWTCFCSICHCLRLPFALKIFLEDGGKREKIWACFYNEERVFFFTS